VRDMRVTDVQFSTATRVFVELDLADGADGLPARLCVKGGFDCAAFEKRAVTFRAEAGAYSEVLPLVSVHTPACYFAATDHDTGQGVVIIEDVVATGGTVNHDLQAPTIDAAAAYLDTLALLHASSWEAPFLSTVPWLHVTLASGSVDHRWFDAEELRRYLEREERAAVVDPALQDPVRLIEMLDSLAPVAARRPHCLLHGDTHMNNTYWSGQGQAAFLDWQGIKVGPWARDVSYFMASNLAVQDRRAHERDLLAHYLGRLRAGGISVPSFDDAWTEYRRWLLMPLLVWIRNSDECQPPAVNILGAQRCSAAVMDLDVLDLYG
jgi:aminoglycoside/choline kinase family phosphotransferase